MFQLEMAHHSIIHLALIMVNDARRIDGSMFVLSFLRPIPYCLVVRISGSHPGGPGSIPGMGTCRRFGRSVRSAEGISSLCTCILLLTVWKTLTSQRNFC